MIGFEIRLTIGSERRGDARGVLMRGWRERGIQAAGSVVVALALVAAGGVVAQDPAAPAPKGMAPAKEDPKGKAPGNPRKGGRGRAPARAPVKGVRKAVDPLANPGGGAANQPLPAPGTFHYRFKFAVGGEPLAAAYYPSKLGNVAPVALLVHERERSSKDFEEPLAELKGLSLAEALQKQGYAVLAFDLRGHGGNNRRNVPKAEFAAVPGDFQAAYYCLVDRHNWGELNLAKLGVVALGEGGNVALAWAAGGGGVSSEGRTGDLGALVLVSPMADAQSQGLNAKPPITALAARVPIDLLVGERDAASSELVDDTRPDRSVRPILKRHPTNKVETFPSALHGYQMLRLEPNLTASVLRFLETTVKAKADEWDGRYLFNPVTYTEIRVIPNPIRPDPATKKAAQ